MVDLCKIKYVFVDFDDTLCIHQYIGVDKRTRQEFCKATINDDSSWYLDEEQCKPNLLLRIFLNSLNILGVKEFNVLTWSGVNTLYTARRRFLDKWYPDLFNKIYISGNREGKLKWLEIFADSEELKPEEILLIEDHPDTIFEAREAGFSALSVSEIMNSVYTLEIEDKY